MKITLQPQRGKKGYALVIAFAFLFIICMTFTGMWLWTSTNTTITQRNNTFNQSAAAAEAATELVFTSMDRDFLLGTLQTNTYYAAMIPDTSATNLWPIQYGFSNTNGTTNVISVSITTTNGTNLVALNSQYSGLQGYVQDCTITATATPRNQRYNVPATVQQSFQAAIIPLFQFAIFYNLNLEMACGQPQNILGPVFCNASIWEGSKLLTFSTNVISAGTNNTSGVNPFNTSYTTGQSQNPGSYAAYDGTPLANFTTGAPTDKANPLTLPIGGGTSTNTNPTNVEAILNLPPPALSVPNAAGYATSNQIYLYNTSDLIISNASYGTNFGGLAPSGTNIVIYFDDQQGTPPLKKLVPDYYVLKQPVGGVIRTTNFVWPAPTPILQALYTTRCNTNVLYAGWSFATNVAFYDYRESSTVQAVQIDIAKFNIWVTNQIASNGGYTNNFNCNFDKGHPIDSIWVYNSVPLTPTTLPAVRIANGQVLPSKYGLTVSTPQPLYTYGNYNVRTNATLGGDDTGTNMTSHTYPAALLADAVTILSSNWNDTTYIAGLSKSSRTPTDTTINAAMLEGIVQTDPTINGDYSGGVENFLRLLEDWGGTLTYNGSIVVMFPSIYATNHWGNSDYYSVPTRHWAFDLNFSRPDGTGMPPLAPASRALVRGNWKTY